jgi:hypothetical protein
VTVFDSALIYRKFLSYVFFLGQFVICYVFLIQLLPRVLIPREIIYASFGGLLMMLRGDPSSAASFQLDQRLFLLVKRRRKFIICSHACYFPPLYSCTTYSLACQPEPQKGSKNRLPVTKTD